MQKYQDSATLNINGALRVLPSAVVTIVNTGGGSSQMYSDNGVTHIASTTTDSNGFFFFYAADGTYTITGTSPLGTFTRTGVELQDISTLDATLTTLASGVNGLNSATTVVNVSAAVAPVNGQALIATGPTAATWQTLSISPTSQISISTVRGASAGFGSTNTAIRCYLNATTVGTDMTYTSDLVHGDKITINTSGIYTISYSEGLPSPSMFGISINSSQLTTNLEGINVADRLTYTQCASSAISSFCGWTGHLTAGAILRGHTVNSTTSGGLAPAILTITRIG